MDHKHTCVGYVRYRTEGFDAITLSYSQVALLFRYIFNEFNNLVYDLNSIFNKIVYDFNSIVSILAYLHFITDFYDIYNFITHVKLYLINCTYISDFYDFRVKQV